MPKSKEQKLKVSEGMQVGVYSVLRLLPERGKDSRKVWEVLCVCSEKRHMVTETLSKVKAHTCRCKKPEKLPYVEHIAATRAKKQHSPELIELLTGQGASIKEYTAALRGNNSYRRIQIEQLFT